MLLKQMKKSLYRMRLGLLLKLLGGFANVFAGMAGKVAEGTGELRGQ